MICCLGDYYCSKNAVHACVLQTANMRDCCTKPTLDTRAFVHQPSRASSLQCNTCQRLNGCRPLDPCGGVAWRTQDACLFDARDQVEELGEDTRLQVLRSRLQKRAPD